MPHRLAPWLFLFGALVGCQDSKPETLVTEGYDQKEMDAAIARAKREVDTFIKEYAKGSGESFAIKVPIKDGDEVEHFWLLLSSYKDGEFLGTINNDPGLVKNVKIGDKRKVKKDDISDWMFIRDDKIHGNYTMRPLLKTLPKAEADKLRAMLAEP